MPIIDDNSRDRVADGLEELCEKLEETLAVRDTPPIVHVDAPTINVEAKAPAPIVNVSAPAPVKGSWTLDVTRDSNDRIIKITINPNN